MSLRQVDKSEYSRFIDSAKSCSANRVYPMSIAEGYQEGDIYVEERAHTAATNTRDGCAVASQAASVVMFWHYCGFVYFSGSPSADLLEEVYQEFLKKKQERRFIIITDDEEIKDFFSSKSDVIIDKRFEYVYDVQNSMADSTAETTSELSIERISGNNIERIHGRIIPSFSWESNEAFLDKGLGYVAVDVDRVAAVAFSSAVSSGEIDIGVETDPDYQRRGLSAKLSLKMCEEIIAMGKEPVWAHAAANVASGKTAERAGFLKTKDNYVIRCS